MPISVQRPLGGRDFSGATTDISFLLIIFFLVSAVFISDKGIYMRVPQEAPAPRELTLDQVLLIQVSTEAPELVLNDGQALALEDLPARLASMLGNWQPEALVLQVEPEVSYETVIRLMEIGRSVGIELFSVSAGGNPLAVDLGELRP
jgi:biopolymer transport protein ExbD